MGKTNNKEKARYYFLPQWQPGLHGVGVAMSQQLLSSDDERIVMTSGISGFSVVSSFSGWKNALKTFGLDDRPSASPPSSGFIIARG